MQKGNRFRNMRSSESQHLRERQDIVLPGGGAGELAGGRLVAPQVVLEPLQRRQGGRRAAAPALHRRTMSAPSRRQITI